MMKMPSAVPALVAAFVCFSGDHADAQTRRPLGPSVLRPSPRPTTSPYLNLLSNTGPTGTAIQYYGQVRPQLEFRRANETQFEAIQSLRRELSDQRQLLQSPTSSLGPTGHQTGFMSYGSYYNMGGRGSARSLGGAGSAPRRAGGMRGQ